MAYGFQVGCGLCVSMGPSHPGMHVAGDLDVSGAQAVANAGSSGLPNTVEDILRSGRLTQAQITAASLPNVMTLFDAPAGQKEEFAHYLQRFILDGYIRGVDVVAIMKSGKRKWSFYIDEIGGSAIGQASGRTSVADRGVVRFDEEFWTDSQTYAKKLQLFYHEMGHAALARPHDDDGIMDQGVNGKLGLGANYSKLVDELFGEAVRGKNTTNASGGGTVPVGYQSFPSGSSGVNNALNTLAAPPTLKLNLGGGITIGDSAAATIKAPNVAETTLGVKSGPAYEAFGPTPDLKVNESNVFSKTLKDLGAAKVASKVS